MTADSFHRLVVRRIKELRTEGEIARANRLEDALNHVDDILGPGGLDGV